MSRIHEALKRAEQERAAIHAPEPTELAAERNVASHVIEADLPPVQSVETVVSPQTKLSSSGTEPLQFEELWAQCARPRWKPDAHLLVFGNSNPFYPGTEQFRTLRSRLYRIREVQELHTLLISSAIPAEGKTLVAANLAHAMVRQRGCRVLLIDADLRSPRIHTLLGAPSSPGLADYLQGGASETEIIQRGHEEGLCFIPAGNHVTHPSELISSNRMKQFLERAKPAFDWIIIDSPPALPVADASVLSGLCDGLLFVVRAGSTPSELAKKACMELKGANILGVVLNNATETQGYGSYYTNYGSGKSSK